MEIRHAVITGAASGMGAIELRRLRASGVSVTALDRDLAVATMYAGDPQVHAEIGDVSNSDWCRKVVEEAESRLPVDFLFHAAGIMPGGSVIDMGSEQIRAIMEVNFGGAVNMVDAVLPFMLGRRSGQIVLFGSIAGIVPVDKFAGYGASKAALNFYAAVLRSEVRPYGVKVLLVTPGAVRTPLLRQAIDGPAAITSTGLLSRLATGDPYKVVAQVDRAVRRGRPLSRPGGRVATGLSRLSPWLATAASNWANKVVDR